MDLKNSIKDNLKNDPGDNLKSSINDSIRNALKIIPKKPGVYLFRDSSRKIIYIGKAKNLSDRVRTYFQPGDTASYPSHPISFFKDRIVSVDFIETDNETEALILESSLIKKNRPKYNVFLKDDKSYPFVAITENERFPRVFVTRNRNIKGARYFGPYVNVKNIRSVLETLRKIFLLRDCRKPKPGKIKNSVCLNYHISLCSGPCTGKVTENEYRENVEYIKMFLKGRDRKIISSLKDAMMKHSSGEEYEKALLLKKKIEQINNLLTDQKIQFSAGHSWDVLSMATEEGSDISAVSLFNYKEGELASINNFIVSNTSHSGSEEILAGFIKNFYSEIDNISSKIYLPCPIEDIQAISEWLTEIKGKRIEITVPKKGEKKGILKMVTRNAGLYFEKKKFEKSSGYSRVFKELLKLQEALALNNMPKRIECFDISNIGASFAVGSMAVFSDGSPLNSNYRHFRIKAVEGQDDFAMIAEVVSRRLRYLEKTKISIEESFYIKPDLIVIDGGKAQYNSAKKVLEEKKLTEIDVVSLAKKEEVLFCKKYPDGFKIDRSLAYMKILIRIRDEAHRFALSYHKKLREREMTKSILDGIRGIGEKKKDYILNR
ncbi:MAG: excinuclease ABC subunit UvrC, partial [Actinobacteria bacterium]|nr:excinuclease ABC subunit UvrC [Actinomycetota bacterium]